MPVVGSLGICTVAAVDVRSIGGGFILPWAYGLGLLFVLCALSGILRRLFGWGGIRAPRGGGGGVLGRLCAILWRVQHEPRHFCHAFCQENDLRLPDVIQTIVCTDKAGLPWFK